MRTIALETASHIGLRKFAKEMCMCVCVCVRARTQCISFFGEGGTCSQVHIWQRLAASREEQISPFCSCKKIQDTRLIKSFFESVSFSFPRALSASS